VEGRLGGAEELADLLLAEAAPFKQQQGHRPGMGLEEAPVDQQLDPTVGLSEIFIKIFYF
jgi:hypothetical protein